MHHQLVAPFPGPPQPGRAFHADNCSGQNKNRFVMQYLAWRVMTGLNKRIEISFMMVGHTKFAPDWCFGLLKQRFRRTKTSSRSSTTPSWWGRKMAPSSCHSTTGQPTSHHTSGGVLLLASKASTTLFSMPKRRDRPSSGSGLTAKKRC